MNVILRPLIPALGGFLLAGLVLGLQDDGSVKATALSGFAFEKTVEYPVPPSELFDAMTGDVSGWWDHHFSDEPHAMTIEPRPGGGFYEMYDGAGNGILHATVTHANRGKFLGFTGPLGLAALGGPVDMVHSFTFEEIESGTRLKLSVHGAGELPKGIGGVVSNVWDHFLVEQLLPYVEDGRHRQK